MNKQINLTLLRNRLLKFEPAAEPAAELSPGAKYLHDHFYMPLLHEKPVKFGDIDFTQFDIDDIVEISRYYDNGINDMRQLNQMYQKLYKANAVLKPAVFI